MIRPVAVVPVKDLDGVKQRLSGALSPAERGALYRAMLEDVLAALAAAPVLAAVRVVTRDPEARAIAARHGAGVIGEDENRGHTAAVVHGARALAAEGVGAVLTVPGDVPLVTPREIAALVGAHGAAPAVTIAPSRDRMGSNAVLLSPPEAMPLRFGDDSFYPHLERARAVGIEPTVVECAGLGLDIDTPEDLRALVATPGDSRAQRYLRESGIAARLAA